MTLRAIQAPNSTLRFVSSIVHALRQNFYKFPIPSENRKRKREREREKERGGHDELAYEGVSRLVRGHIAGQVASNDPLYRNLHLI